MKHVLEYLTKGIQSCRMSIITAEDQLERGRAAVQLAKDAIARYEATIAELEAEIEKVNSLG